MRRTIQALALVTAAGLGAFGGITYTDREVPNLTVVGQAAYAFREPGWRTVLSNGDSAGVYKAFTDTRGETSVMAIWKEKMLSLAPYPTHSVRVMHPDSFLVAGADTLWMIDEWLVRNPHFVRFNRPGHVIRVLEAVDDTLSLVQKVTVGSTCPDNSHSTTFDAETHVHE